MGITIPYYLKPKLIAKISLKLCRIRLHKFIILVYSSSCLWLLAETSK